MNKAFKHLNDQMPLRLEDFDAVEINWKNKYENIIKVSKELDLSLDSLFSLMISILKENRLDIFCQKLR